MRRLALRRRGSTALIATLLSTMLLAAPAAAGEPSLPGECPQVKPLSEVTVGATGNGWTVERGTQRERFRFEILGRIDDGIAPGRDMIVVEVSDTAGNDMLERAGGIWSGMSGSPVYLGNKLLGAIAYGFSAGPSMIGGVTPAVYMDDVLDYGAASANAAPARVAVPQSMRATLADRAGVSTAAAASFERLPVSLSASGLNARGRSELQKTLNKHDMSAIVFSASRAARSAGAAITDRPAPGGNFAGVISYGDVTLGGIGTTTYVCGNKALAFGHPLTFGGIVAFGANNANAIAVVSDQTTTPFKMANITGLFGRLDQDRLTAIRAKLNATPAMRPVTSHVSNVDTGVSRNGRTDVTMNDWMPDVAALHLLSNADVVFDHVGKGSSQVSWTITGKRRNGNTWQLEYSNRYASQNDISRDSVFQLAEQLATIQFNPFEAINFTSVDIDASFDDTFRRFAIEGVKISKNGGAFRSRDFITVSPGDNLRARVSLRQYRGDVTTVQLAVNVPNDVAFGDFGSLLIRGGGEFFFPPSSSANSFPKLLTELRNTPRNDDLIADLSFGFEGQSGPTASDVERMNSVVVGAFEIGVGVE